MNKFWECRRVFCRLLPFFMGSFPYRGFEELNKHGAPVIVYLWGAHDLKSRFDHAVSLGAFGVSCDNPLELLPYVRPLPTERVSGCNHEYRKKNKHDSRFKNRADSPECTI